MLARAVNLRIKDIGLFYLRNAHLRFLKEWRNSQMDILRQDRPLTDMDQEIWYKKVRCDRSQVIFSLKMGVGGGGNGIFIGYCGITNIDTNAKKGEVSFLLNPVFAHNYALYRDIFLKTLYLLSFYGFKKLHLKEIFTETYLFRSKHIKILEEFGFLRKGILRKRKFAKSKYWDSIIYCFECKNWQKRKGKIKNELER